MSSLLTEYVDVSETEEAKPPSDDLDKQNSSAEEMSNPEDVPPLNIQEAVQKTEQKDSSSEPERSTKPQFKNVVAIVDPPRPGLHPDVIKALRTHPRLKTLVLVSFSQNTQHNSSYFVYVS